MDIDQEEQAEVAASLLLPKQEEAPSETVEEKEPLPSITRAVDDDSVMLDPSSSSSHAIAIKKEEEGLPADIELILSLGANENDHLDEVPTTNYEQVVRRAKERAGFTAIENGNEETMEEGELEVIENEMKEGGVVRAGEEEVLPVQHEEEEEGLTVAQALPSEQDQPLVAAAQLTAESDNESTASSSSSSSSSSDSSSDSDSDSPAQPLPQTRRNRKRPNAKARARATSVGSDLSDNDINITIPPTTAHELPEPVPSLPSISKFPDSVKLIKFGSISSIIDNVVVIKADTVSSKDWKTLDEGTLICWEDKIVIGSVFEVFGSVQQPYYSLRFPSEKLPLGEEFVVGKGVWYSVEFGSSFVWVSELRKMGKGSDASNVWDEEAGENEREWSDDEEEAAYKRNLKAERRSRAPSSRAPSSAPSQSHHQSRASTSTSSGPTTSITEEEYTPLSRPKNLHLIGDIPPPGAEGRRMFERDSGRSMEGEVEFEFSDDEGDFVQVGGAERERESHRLPPSMNSRGGERDRVMFERGDSRSNRGRGGDRGRGGNRGRGRGSHQNSNNGREIRPLPSSSSSSSHRRSPLSTSSTSAPLPSPLPPRPPQPLSHASLPQRPDFIAPETAEEKRLAALNTSAANLPSRPIVSATLPLPPTSSSSSSSTTPSQYSSQPQQQPYSNPSFQQHSPHSHSHPHQPHQQSYPSHQHQPYPSYPPNPQFNFQPPQPSQYPPNPNPAFNFYNPMMMGMGGGGGGPAFDPWAFAGAQGQGGGDYGAWGQGGQGWYGQGGQGQGGNWNGGGGQNGRGGFGGR